MSNFSALSLCMRARGALAPVTPACTFASRSPVLICRILFVREISIHTPAPQRHDMARLIQSNRDRLNRTTIVPQTPEIVYSAPCQFDIEDCLRVGDRAVGQRPFWIRTGWLM